MFNPDLMSQCSQLQNTESLKASKDFFWELQLRELRTSQKDRFLELVEGQQDEIAAIDLPPSSAGKVSAEALKSLPEHRLQRLFESGFTQEERYRVLTVTVRAPVTTGMMKHSGYSAMEPRDVAFGYSLMLGLGL